MRNNNRCPIISSLKSIPTINRTKKEWSVLESIDDDKLLESEKK